MRKLQFTAQHGQPHSLNDNAVVQKQVQQLLVQKLGQFGFETLPQSGDQVAVSVDNHTLPLSITCQCHDNEGNLVCEIASYPDEEQDWVDRIAERSLLNQLAQAVENTLKTDKSFTEFEWKNS
ncbi:hypothetical protein ACE01U_14615 [Acinetobacter sp. BSP-153]|uniref:hypothetical protein n=1 Tax=Acinetobacter sp. BSP-153 TaxID=3344663 RepID=UPI0037705329